MKNPDRPVELTCGQRPAPLLDETRGAVLGGRIAARAADDDSDLSQIPALTDLEALGRPQPHLERERAVGTLSQRDLLERHTRLGIGPERFGREHRRRCEPAGPGHLDTDGAPDPLRRVSDVANRDSEHDGNDPGLLARVELGIEPLEDPPSHGLRGRARTGQKATLSIAIVPIATANRGFIAASRGEGWTALAL